MARNKKNGPRSASPAASDSIASLKHPAKRKNIPAAGLEAQGVIREEPRIRYEYNPHLPPALRSAPDTAEADRLPELLQLSRQRALSGEAFGALSGLRSLPFPRPPRLKAAQKWQVAVKVIDPRGNEGLRVTAMG
jgi:hypothetical protein